jgi:hypothetical protein
MSAFLCSRVSSSAECREVCRGNSPTVARVVLVVRRSVTGNLFLCVHVCARAEVDDAYVLKWVRMYSVMSRVSIMYRLECIYNLVCVHLFFAKFSHARTQFSLAVSLSTSPSRLEGVGIKVDTSRAKCTAGESCEPVFCL